ncbi:SpoIIIAH-like family protein [Brockia lithotrophica]|uniref:SpoIIIAH-like protein n=1 Tax=Brockia lithotrophica TaxID=933949 RepID=A0A660L3Z6_9BACL|nr:SpoIIIAH-like family protein [Brockia lithotrophica]RKQ88741.1 SpoIIIAH-like protein [Brockia lithotrophica]
MKDRHPQTFWFMLMLTLLAVMSVYYLFFSQPPEGEVARKDEAAPSAQSASNATGKEAASGEKGDVALRTARGDDAFALLRLEREQSRSRILEQYYSILNEKTGDKDAVATASARISRLEDLESKEIALEGAIKAAGYPDAVVILDEERAHVFVKANALSAEEAVKIIGIVAKEANLKGTDVTVTARP